MGKLSATAVKAATRPGRIGDGDGLFLVVKPSGTKSWMVRVQKHGTRRDFGLGSASKVSLKVAHERARAVRQRIGTVLNWAYASGYRESEAPMRAISRGLPRQPK